ncbi:TPA: glycosyltransferase family 4 protein, partial [Escherichia coli]|nr:glycosyltransferase [Escherichia coli]HCM9972400.1 glycosyltransferase family 4 protein [Escherichia coli]
SLEKSNYGGSIVSRSNLKGLKHNTALQIKEIAIVRKIEDIYSYELLADTSKIKTAFNNFRGYAGRLNSRIISEIRNIIIDYKPTIIYLDSSLLGCIAKWCKNEVPQAKVVTFFHNAEYDFEMGRLKTGKLHFLPSLYSSVLAEREAVKYSDIIITLHKNDSERLFELYQRRADFCVPVCIIDEPYLDIIEHDKTIELEKPFTIGFIGTAFYANIQAAEYISQHIATAFNNDTQFIIAGNGFEDYATKLNRPNLKTYGFVESLYDFYENIDVVISPITIGGGMKVKIAEAFKYNRKVIASSFSLIGYEDSLNNSDVCSCSNLKDYLHAINHLRKSREVKSTTRELYKKYYSEKACASYFKDVFK